MGRLWQLSERDGCLFFVIFYEEEKTLFWLDTKIGFIYSLTALRCKAV